MTQLETKEITTVERSSPQQVVRTVQQSTPSVTSEPPQKVFAKKKTIFRFYQIIWYCLGVVETLLIFRFAFKAFGASTFSSFVSFVYAITNPLALPFQGIFPASVNGSYIIEWSTVVGIFVYALLAYALVEVFQFVKPVSKEEVEQTVDEQ